MSKELMVTVVRDGTTETTKIEEVLMVPEETLVKATGLTTTEEVVHTEAGATLSIEETAEARATTTISTIASLASTLPRKRGTTVATMTTKRKTISTKNQLLSMKLHPLSRSPSSNRRPSQLKPTDL